MKEATLDLEEASKVIDLSRIYYVVFKSKNSVASAINIREMFLSDDGETPTAIESLEEDTMCSQLVKTEYFTLDGRQHSALQHGANIVRRTYSDGRVESVKVIK